MKPTNISVQSWGWAKTHGIIKYDFCGDGEGVLEVDTSQMREGTLVVKGICFSKSVEVIPRPHENYFRFDYGSGMDFNTEFYPDDTSSIEESSSLSGRVLRLVIWGKKEKASHTNQSFLVLLSPKKTPPKLSSDSDSSRAASI